MDDNEDEIVPYSTAELPDGSVLCLCGRLPTSEGVIEELARAQALSWAFDLGLSRCLKDAAAAFDAILEDMKPRRAKQLRGMMKNMEVGFKQIDPPDVPYDSHQVLNRKLH